MSNTLLTLNRRRLLIAAPAFAGASALAGCASAPKVYDLQVGRDDGCVCCHAWAEVVQKTGPFKVTLFDAGDAPSFKRSKGVPADLEACHTGLLEGYVIEGHVSAADMLRLVSEKPAGVLGLSVPGMPRGSAGMEQASGVKDAYTVWAFRAGGERYAFATYAANAATAKG